MLDNFEPIDPEVMIAMLDLAEITSGMKHIELGSGNGQFVAEAGKRGANSLGYEINKELAQMSIETHGIKVINKNVFNVDVSEADLITFWFTKLPETELLLDKLHREMKSGAKLVASPGQARLQWQPIKTMTLNRYQFCLFIKD